MATLTAENRFQPWGHDITQPITAEDPDVDGHAYYAYVDGFGGIHPIAEPEAYAMLLARTGLLGFVGGAQ